jgi:hypothetical protein
MGSVRSRDGRSASSVESEAFRQRISLRTNGQTRGRPLTPICPRCGRSPQGESGFCASCDQDLVAEQYLERAGADALARGQLWASRAARARERKRKQRLLDAVRPRTPESSLPSDPLELAHEVLTHLGRVGQALRAIGSTTMADLEEASEGVRRLAWGPE